MVEVDETYIGGKVRYHRRGQEDFRKNKTVVMGAIERGGKLRVRAQPMTHITRKAAEQFIRENVASNVEAIYTDEAQIYDWLDSAGIEHESVAHGREEWVRATSTPTPLRAHGASSTARYSAATTSSARITYPGTSTSSLSGSTIAEPVSVP